MPLGNQAAMPRRRMSLQATWRLWTFGVLFGALLLTAFTVLQHSGHNAGWRAHDQQMLRRYASQLLEVHAAYTQAEEAGDPRRFLTGYLNADEVTEELQLAYRGAIQNGWLNSAGHADYALALHYLGQDTAPAGPLRSPDQALVRKLIGGEAPTAADVTWIEAHARDAPSWFANYLANWAEIQVPAQNSAPEPNWYRRYLRSGAVNYGIWAFTLLFLPAALIGQLRRPKSRPAWRLTGAWFPVLGLTYALWTVLATHGVYDALSQFTSAKMPAIWQAPAYHLTTNLFYLILQAGPVVLIAAIWLPSSRSFRRVFGLGLAQLVRPAHLTLVLGLFGLYAILGLASYELEQWLGFCDTRDFLDPGLIDSGWLGLISQLVLAGVTAPVFEEILFRGFLFTSLRSRWNVWVAALVSSLMFAGLHYYSWLGLLSIAAFGMVMCWLYQRTGSLWPGILFHALLNIQITTSNWFLHSLDFTWWGYLGWGG